MQMEAGSLQNSKKRRLIDPKKKEEGAKKRPKDSSDIQYTEENSRKRRGRAGNREEVNSTLKRQDKGAGRSSVNRPSMNKKRGSFRQNWTKRLEVRRAGSREVGWKPTGGEGVSGKITKIAEDHHGIGGMCAQPEKVGIISRGKKQTRGERFSSGSHVG